MPVQFQIFYSVHYLGFSPFFEANNKSSSNESPISKRCLAQNILPAQSLPFIFKKLNSNSAKAPILCNIWHCLLHWLMQGQMHWHFVCRHPQPYFVSRCKSPLSIMIVWGESINIWQKDFSFQFLLFISQSVSTLEVLQIETNAIQVPS